MITTEKKTETSVAAINSFELIVACSSKFHKLPEMDKRTVWGKLVPLLRSLSHCLKGSRAITEQPQSVEPRLHLLVTKTEPSLQKPEQLDLLSWLYEKHQPLPANIELLLKNTFVHEISNEDSVIKKTNAILAESSRPYFLLTQPGTFFSWSFLDQLKSTFETNPQCGLIAPATILEVGGSKAPNKLELPYGFNLPELAAELSQILPSPLQPGYGLSTFCVASTVMLGKQLPFADDSYSDLDYGILDYSLRLQQEGRGVFLDNSWLVFRDKERPRTSSQGINTDKSTFLAKRSQAHESQLAVSLKAATTHPATDLLSQEDYWKFKLATLATMDARNEPQQRVIYILPRIDVYGGIISVMQLTNQLLALGFNANIATYGPVNPETFELAPCYFRPYVFPNCEIMIDQFPDADLVVATHWTTVYSAIQLQALRPNLKLAYLVQDFEPDFCHTAPERQQAERTYRLIKDQIVKTIWLRDKIAPYGGRIRLIPLGLNLEIFTPFAGNKKPRVIASTRKTSKHRNYEMTLRALALLHRERPDIELAIYGQYDEADIDSYVIKLGKLSKLQDVACAVGESTVLFDCSTFQGFGRPGLEAMACGTAAVLTREGGITQYAKHAYNCLLIDPTSLEDIASKILMFLDDENLRENCTARGIQTASEYSHHLEGTRTAAFFNELLPG